MSLVISAQKLHTSTKIFEVGDTDIEGMISTFGRGGDLFGEVCGVSRPSVEGRCEVKGGGTTEIAGLDN